MTKRQANLDSDELSFHLISVAEGVYQVCLLSLSLSLTQCVFF